LLLSNVIAPGIVNAGLAKGQMETEPQYARLIKNVIPLGEPPDGGAGRRSDRLSVL
jgi:hypothetical protein